MTHHHFMEHQASVPATPDQKEFPQLLWDHQIDCLLCGHTHRKFSYFYGDVSYRPSHFKCLKQDSPCNT